MSLGNILVTVAIILFMTGMSIPAIKPIKKSIDEQQQINHIVQEHNKAIDLSARENRLVNANNTVYYPNLQVKPITLHVGKREVCLGRYREIRIRRK